jgi:hypothetical protein
VFRKGKNTRNLVGDLLGVKTWRYKPTPLKMNLILEIRLIPEQVGKLFLHRVVSFPSGFFYSANLGVAIL